MDYRDLSLELSDGVALVTLNRPEKMNALGPRLVHELLDVTQTSQADDACKVMLVTGAGRGFCAGADLSVSEDEQAEDQALDELAGYREILRSPMGHWGALFSALGHYPKPMIAAVNGAAAGAGLSLALAADIRFAAPEARFISVFVSRALIPDSGTSFHLPGLIGRGRAIEMMLTGHPVDARTAEAWGLVNRVVASGQLLPEAMALAQRLAGGPSVTIELTKRLVNNLTRRELDEQLQSETWAANVCNASEDRAEGVNSFLEKRDPQWTGR